jgi:hypothetical protein
MAHETNDYIVKFTKNVHDYTRTSEKFDAFLGLNSTNSIPTIVIRTCKDKFDVNNKILFHKYITKEFAKVEFNDSNRSCSLSYQDGYSRSISYKSLIEFDDNSSSAYSTFKESFEKLLNTKSESQYFDSGRLRYVGEVLELEDEENSYNGNGVLYYNTCSNSKKFIGEFEDGEFDGAGEFYNDDGNIKIVANNISNGIPVQKGKLHINFQSREEVVEIDFSRLWDTLCIKDKRHQRKIVASDNFVNETARLYWGNSDKSMDDVVFEEKSTSQQNVEIWNQLKEISNEINKTRLEAKTESQSRKVADRITICFVMFSILLNFILLFSK